MGPLPFYYTLHVQLVRLKDEQSHRSDFNKYPIYILKPLRGGRERPCSMPLTQGSPVRRVSFDPFKHKAFNHHCSILLVSMRFKCLVTGYHTTELKQHVDSSFSCRLLVWDGVTWNVVMIHVFCVNVKADQVRGGKKHDRRVKILLPLLSPASTWNSPSWKKPLRFTRWQLIKFVVLLSRGARGPRLCCSSRLSICVCVSREWRVSEIGYARFCF